MADKNKKQKQKPAVVVIVIAVLVMSLVAYFAYLSGKSKDEKKSEGNISAVEEALSRNLDNDYPPTPKEVMKYYNSITKCFYNEDLTEDEIDALGTKVRGLYDADLLAINENGAYLIQLRKDVEAYHAANRKVTSCSVSASTNVDFYTVDGYEFARLLCTYNINENGSNSMLRMIYLLRKDADKRWKIYGWDLEENVDLNGDGVPGD